MGEIPAYDGKEFPALSNSIFNQHRGESVTSTNVAISGAIRDEPAPLSVPATAAPAVGVRPPTMPTIIARPVTRANVVRCNSSSFQETSW